MELYQLEYFQAVAKQKHFTKAAEFLHLSQPTLSRQIKLLEEELDTELFYRNGKQLTLTKSGEYLLQRTEKVLGDVNRLKMDLKHKVDGRKMLSIGTIPTVSRFYLPNIIPQVQSQNQSVKYQLSVDWTSQEVLENLDQGKFELCIAQPVKKKGYERVSLFFDPFVLLVPNNDQWRSVNKISLTDLQKESFILTTYPCSIRDTIIHTCLEKGFKPSIVTETDHICAVKGLVAAEVGISFMPLLTLKETRLPKNIKYILIDEPIGREISLMWLKNKKMSEWANRFIGHFKLHSNDQAQ
ncbi:LysR family transcriptional regulator [Paludifilum halophilum]|uniref:HTH lysR-type domain-containing protein n=1 Tax=Paludifilum halophilum TaxID=1642702 RepID=A0A235B6J1_9BACL|nr:LysR family transcriptional regulator [Paludifilum halophilum]OYD07225.1 hypothetical protein CHM34_12640 [Paludifilum halophilum]